MLFLNGYEIYEYDKYLEKSQDEADGEAKTRTNKISAETFKINEKEVFESTEKSLRAL